MVKEDRGRERRAENSGSVDQTMQGLEDIGAYSRRGEKVLEGSVITSSIFGDQGPIEYA